MAYDAGNLTRVAGGSGFTLWHYHTADAATAVDTACYFNDSANMSNNNDLILALTAPGGTPQLYTCLA